jgi:hypothetical protein
MTSVARAVDAVQQRIASAGGDPTRVKIVAVTKGFGADAACEAVEAGIADIGENYAQELLEKSPHCDGARWHFLGAVQRNKVAKLAPVVAVWQGLDRVSAGEEIARRAPGATVLVQVNASGQRARNGCRPEDAGDLVAALTSLGLDVAGLMAVATAADRRAAHAEFERVAGLRGELGLRELSIGMSDDLELGVAAGSTMVRVGRALFGERPARLPEGPEVPRR